MIAKYALSLVASLGVAAVSPLAAGAAQFAFATNPISVNACNIATTMLPVTWENPIPRPVADLRYHFVNNGTVAARAITFDVASDSQSERIVERGTFSPGVGIDRTADDRSLAFANAVTCRVTEVEFADGTSWHARGAAKVAAGR